MKKVVRLSCLHAIWSLALPQPRTSHDQPHQYASKAVHAQIEGIAAGGIVDLEIEILADLQKLLFGPKGLGKFNMLPIWICLWLLILTYRRTLTNGASKKNKDSRFALAQHMYHMFVAVYSALFRPSSPVWLNWFKDEVFELWGKDRRITHCIGALKTELSYACSSPLHITYHKAFTDHKQAIAIRISLCHTIPSSTHSYLKMKRNWVVKHKKNR
jgi:hypothetical protein